MVRKVHPDLHWLIKKFQKKQADAESMIAELSTWKRVSSALIVKRINQWFIYSKKVKAASQKKVAGNNEAPHKKGRGMRMMELNQIIWKI